MITTTYWQSLELMQAKLDTETADFVYERQFDILYDEKECAFKTEYRDTYKLRERTEYDTFCVNLVPAWSMSKLWEVVGKNAQFSFEESDSPEYIIERLIDLYKTYAN